MGVKGVQCYWKFSNISSCADPGEDRSRCGALGEGGKAYLQRPWGDSPTGPLA